MRLTEGVVTMKLSLLLKTYREAHEISQRELARRCGLSNSLISLMEMGVNPQTGKEMSPDLETYRKIADGLEMSVQRLFEVLGDDATVSLDVGRKESIDVSAGYYETIIGRQKSKGYVDVLLNPEEKTIIESYRDANRGTQAAIKKLLDLN